MKVIVNFNSVRVIVPCVDEGMLVKDLIHEATSRYRKATSKPENAWVVIHNLKTCVDGAILDPDDRLNDVADDREQIIATFEEGDCSSNGAFLHLNDNHDGTSLASDSLGTDSPDVFSSQTTAAHFESSGISVSHTVPVDSNSNNLNVLLQCNDVEITEDEINTCTSVPLQVRRGSEPVLNRLSPVLNDPVDLSKRWSTAVAIDTKGTRKGSNDSLSDSVVERSDDEAKSPLFVKTSSLSPKSIKEEGYASEEKSENTPSSATSSSTFSRFSRGSGRQSMINGNIDIWVEAADRQLVKIKNETNAQKCCDSDSNVNGNERKVDSVTKSLHCHLESSEQVPQNEKSAVIIRLKSEGGPLGIHVVPFCDEKGQENGLVIQGIEPDGVIDRDGRLESGDKIIEINSRSLTNVKFQDAQDIFKQALFSPEIVLKLYKAERNSSSVPPIIPPPMLSKRPPPPPVMPKPKKDEVEIGLVEGEESEGHSTKVATLTATKKLMPAYGLINNKPVAVSNTLATANTRKIGRKYHIRLTKSNDGLGFSITTRDNPAGGNCPIYIKTILPKGAAIHDGRLKPGDRLLEVNGIEMTNKTHIEAVTVLRNIPLGFSVDLIVSRQEPDPSPSPKLPRQLPPECSADIQIGRQREVLTFEIPLNDTGSAGLGVSVKGKTCAAPQGNSVDLGIFVKSVIHGGAASKDGRLLPNDQLISINGIPLLGIPNGEAMETLRRAMTQCEGPKAKPNAITLTVARRVSSPRKEANDAFHQRNDSIISTDSCGEEQMIFSYPNVPNINSGDALNETQSSAKSEGTVIYNPKEFHASSPKTLESQLYHKHPVADRLTGRDASPSTHYVSRCETDTRDSPSKSSNRVDVIIEGDKENVDVNYSYNKMSNIVNRSDSSEVEESPFSNGITPHEDDPCFQRDGFGRQSISEKRHAQLDAKNTDTYKRNKKTKEEKDKCKQSQEQRNCDKESVNTDSDLQPHDAGSCQSPGSCPYHAVLPPRVSKKKKNVGPALGMRKSSSLESLQTMMQELQKEQLDSKGGNPFAGPRPATLKVSRSRGTNESFRAAVDKSYDAPGIAPEAMETVAEEESESGSSIQAVPKDVTSVPITSRPSGALSVASTHITAVSATTATTTTSSQMTEDDKKQFISSKKTSKKKGLFRSFFKFGSKKGKDASRVHPRDAVEDVEKIQARRVAQLEQERIQEHYKRLMELQKHETRIPQHHFQSDSSVIQRQQLHATLAQGSELESARTIPKNDYVSRDERLQHLRSQQQRQQLQKNYGKDGHDNRYNREPRETSVSKQQVGCDRKMLLPLSYSYSCPTNANMQPRKVCSFNRNNNDSIDPNHARVNSYEICKEAMERPGSRVGIADSNNKYSHYMNYREIQQQMEQYNPYSRIPNMPLENVDTLRTVPQRVYSSGPLVPGRRKPERPTSSYEFRNSGQIQNIAIYEQRMERQLMQQQNNVQYGVITRNGVNCSSYPRRQIINKTKHFNEAPCVTISNQHSQQPVYDSKATYTTNHNNGVTYGSNQRSAAFNSYMKSAPANSHHEYYHSSRYQREALKTDPGSNV
ncbi:partitioning defective 3-like protein [Leptotrombidium deliense]|uniref:Partitioning defective 3-like protein n=1 Tax=Leptotrombidium deliense TaxID=299467 RepID=A0A443SVI5_9ACAR|nr:partitioning defective 3-like protein [Leptotrombidium deliense]